MRNGRGKLDIPYLAIFSGILLVAVVASLFFFPEWRESPATIVALVVAAVGGVVGLAANFRSAFIREKVDTPPGALDFDTLQYRRNEENVTGNVRLHQETLQAYFDKMTELLLEYSLRESLTNSNVRNIARARTVAMVKELDADRNQQLFAFLRLSRLIQNHDPIIDLNRIDFKNADLRNVNLIEVNLYKADLSNANLSGAELSLTDLRGVNLTGADLSEAELVGADLTGADLSRANLTRANLRKAKLIDVRNLTTEQLDQARSLDGALMPDGVLLQHRTLNRDGHTYAEWKAFSLTKQKND